MTELNSTRAGWASVALEAFANEVVTDPEDCLPDLLCAFMHWADNDGSDFDAHLSRARRYYESETEMGA